MEKIRVKKQVEDKTGLRRGLEVGKHFRLSPSQVRKICGSLSKCIQSYFTQHYLHFKTLPQGVK